MRPERRSVMLPLSPLGLPSLEPVPESVGEAVPPAAVGASKTLPPDLPELWAGGGRSAI